MHVQIETSFGWSDIKDACELVLPNIFSMYIRKVRYWIKSLLELILSRHPKKKCWVDLGLSQLPNIDKCNLSPPRTIIATTLGWNAREGAMFSQKVICFCFFYYSCSGSIYHRVLPFFIDFTYSSKRVF